MIRSLLFFLPFFFSPSLFMAGEVTIEGKAPSYVGKEAELVGYKDYLTEMDTVLDRSRVSLADSAFSFEVETPRIRPAWIRIGQARSKIYLEPGADYEVRFPPIPEDRVQRSHGYTDVEMTFFELSEHDANNLVIDFNRVHEHFFATNYRSIGIRYASGSEYAREEAEFHQGGRPDSLTRARIRNTPSISYLVDSLRKTLKERYAEVDKAWFRTHYQHALAPLVETAEQNRKAIYRNYFGDEAVRFHHEEYMKHFLNFYDKYLIDFARRHDSLLDLQQVLREKRDPAPILRALKSEKADYMGREAIRELVVIDGMFDAFYHRDDLDQEGIHAVLDSIASNSPREGARVMAKNLSNFLSKRQKGSRAPGFRLIDRDTNSVSLKNLSGRPVYMNFWATWNETSLKDMRVIEKLHEKYGKHVQFLSICTDDKLRDMKRFLKEHPEYDWKFLHAGSGKNIEEAYEVASIPAYYLLNEEGRFIVLNGPKPAEDARSYLHRLYKRIQRERKQEQHRGWDH